MKWLGVKQAAMDALKLPGDFKARLKAPHVAARAKSIKELGVIALPIVEWKTKRLIAGCDRVAALTLNGADVVEVRAVEGTPEELRRLMLAENIERRPKERDELLVEYAAVIEAEVVAERVNGQPSEKPPGRPQTPKGEARERAAAALGVSPESIRKAQERLADKAKEPAKKTERLYEDWGLKIPATVDTAVTTLIESMDSADQVLRGVQSSLTRALEACPESWQWLRIRLATMHSEAKAIAQKVRATRPRAVCPYCKGVAALAKKCAACAGATVVNGERLDSVPAELRLRGDDAMVSVDGQPVRLADLNKRR